MRKGHPCVRSLASQRVMNNAALQPDAPLNRRDFLRSASALAASAGLAGRKLSDAELQDAIREAITRKPKGHDFVIDRRRNAPAVGRHMSVTGG